MALGTPVPRDYTGSLCRAVLAAMALAVGRSDAAYSTMRFFEFQARIARRQDGVVTMAENVHLRHQLVQFLVELRVPRALLPVRRRKHHRAGEQFEWGRPIPASL